MGTITGICKKVDNKNSSVMCYICSKLTKKAKERWL